MVESVSAYQKRRRGEATERVLTGAAVRLPAVPPVSLYLFLKRLIDVVGSLVGLIALFPVFVVTAILIAMDSPGPVIYRRRVLAQRGQDDAGEGLATFDAFKFRSMRADADEYLAKNPELLCAFEKDYKLSDDPRVTRLGRFLRRSSIDELPQLVNVLLGQMTLVGPRMITPEELPRYGVHQEDLLSVKPGLTGLWQVSGRANVGYDERVRLDMAYIQSRSLQMDIQILLQTVRCVLTGRGAY